MSVTLRQGSILDSDADYIVNPANSFLRHEGGLAEVIAGAATAPFDFYAPELRGFSSAQMRQAKNARLAAIELWHAEHREAPLIAYGDAYMTSAGALPYKGVIHAVGPIWKDGSLMETDLLEMAYESALSLVPEGSTVALPAISAGIFGVPIEVVARVALAVATWYDALRIEFWLFSGAHMAAFKQPPVFG